MEKIAPIVFILVFAILVHFAQKKANKKEARERTLKAIKELLSGSTPNINYKEIYETIAYDLQHNTDDFIDLRAINNGFEVSYVDKRFSLILMESGYQFKNISTHKYWIAHKEEIYAKEQKEWKLNNILEYEKKYNRLRGFSSEQRAWIYERDKGICQICLKPVGKHDYHADHVKPYSKGGLTTIANGQCTHSFCNMSKGAKF